MARRSQKVGRSKTKKVNERRKDNIAILLIPLNAYLAIPAIPWQWNHILQRANPRFRDRSRVTNPQGDTATVADILVSVFYRVFLLPQASKQRTKHTHIVFVWLILIEYNHRYATESISRTHIVGHTIDNNFHHFRYRPRVQLKRVCYILSYCFCNINISFISCHVFPLPTLATE